MKGDNLKDPESSLSAHPVRSKRWSKTSVPFIIVLRGIDSLCPAPSTVSDLTAAPEPRDIVDARDMALCSERLLAARSACRRDRDFFLETSVLLELFLSGRPISPASRMRFFSADIWLRSRCLAALRPGHVEAKICCVPCTVSPGRRSEHRRGRGGFERRRDGSRRGNEMGACLPRLPDQGRPNARAGVSADESVDTATLPHHVERPRWEHRIRRPHRPRAVATQDAHARGLLQLSLVGRKHGGARLRKRTSPPRAGGPHPEVCPRVWSPGTQETPITFNLTQSTQAAGKPGGMLRGVSNLLRIYTEGNRS